MLCSRCASIVLALLLSWGHKFSPGYLLAQLTSRVPSRNNSGENKLFRINTYKTSASVDSKGVARRLNHLKSTLTKKWEGGGRLPFCPLSIYIVLVALPASGESALQALVYRWLLGFDPISA